jgi:hypothetical protein
MEIALFPRKSLEIFWKRSKLTPNFGFPLFDTKCFALIMAK